MAFSPPPYDNLWKYLRDVVLAFVIVVGGILLAHVIAEPFRNVSDLAYPAALCIGLLPFWWFTRHCHIHNCDVFDYLALSLFSVLAVIWHDAFAGASKTVVILVTAVAFGAFVSGWSRIRRMLNPHAKDDLGTG
jgi:hypothetical protein